MWPFRPESLQLPALWYLSVFTVLSAGLNLKLPPKTQTRVLMSQPPLQQVATHTRRLCSSVKTTEEENNNDADTKRFLQIFGDLVKRARGCSFNRRSDSSSPPSPSSSVNSQQLQQLMVSPGLFVTLYWWRRREEQLPFSPFCSPNAAKICRKVNGVWSERSSRGVRRALLLQEVKAGDQGGLEMLSRGSCRLHVEKSAVKSLHGGGFQVSPGGFFKGHFSGFNAGSSVSHASVFLYLAVTSHNQFMMQIKR